jgi:peptide/nickel transport system substrate-binding protein
MYDLEYTIMMIAHPDTFSDRFGPANNTSNILGVEEFRSGEADHISGLRVFNDGRSLEYSFESVNPSMQFASAIWTTPVPKHRWETVPFAEQRDHAYSRTDILGNGAFMFSSTVAGEAVSLVANPNFWLGAPKLDGINIATIHPDLIGEAMLIGEFDIATMPVSEVPDYADRLTNSALLSRLQRRFDFMGFRFGTMDHDAQVFNPNPDTIINDLALRRALAYGRDEATVATAVLNGFRFPIATTNIPWQGAFMRTDMVGYSIFDQALANQILDDAGYEWVEGEQFRRHKDTGEHFQIVWLVADSPVARIYVPHHQQNWAEIGLDVVLYNNNLIEFNLRIETLTHDLDEGEVHMYDAAWLFGANPNPSGLWGVTSHNDTRYQSERLDGILAAIASQEAWDQDWLIEQYYEWQLAVFEEAPWIPLMTGVEIFAVNNRVLNYSLIRQDGTKEVSEFAWHLWDLTQPTPFTAR